jgi:Spy/CpxP family protein refolding chaperone
MKTWIRRTLIGVAACATLFGGLAAYAHSRWGGCGHGWHAMSDADAAQIKARVVERVGAKLSLDAAQKTKLGALADALGEQRKALVGNTADPRAEVQALIAGNTFDRARASALVQGKVAAVSTQSPQVITALADFYDSLRPEQQAQVREFLARRGHWAHGPHGAGSEPGGPGG